MKEEEREGVRSVRKTPWAALDGGKEGGGGGGGGGEESREEVAS